MLEGREEGGRGGEGAVLDVHGFCSGAFVGGCGGGGW